MRRIKRIVLEGLRLRRHLAKAKEPLSLVIRSPELKAINRALKRYIARPVFSVYEGSLMQVWLPQSRGTSADRLEWAAMRNAMYLLSTGLIYRIRRCECGKWFFRRFAHQSYCSGECRVRHYLQSDDGKEYKRRKAREYYELHKRGRVRER
jgi:hypothetical protein